MLTVFAQVVIITKPQTVRKVCCSLMKTLEKSKLGAFSFKLLPYSQLLPVFLDINNGVEIPEQVLLSTTRVTKLRPRDQSCFPPIFVGLRAKNGFCIFKWLEKIKRIILASTRFNNLRYVDDTTPWQKEELKSLLMKVKEESEKPGLKFNIPKTKIIPSGPITSCHIDEETVETVTNFTFLGSKITADGDCSHEIKRCLLLGRKVMTNLENMDISLPTKVHLVQAMVFPLIIMDMRVGL